MERGGGLVLRSCSGCLPAACVRIATAGCLINIPTASGQAPRFWSREGGGDYPAETSERGRDGRGTEVVGDYCGGGGHKSVGGIDMRTMDDERLAMVGGEWTI